MRRWLAALGFMMAAAGRAEAAPRYLDDCLAEDSTKYLRMESCTFSLKADDLDPAQRVQVLLSRARAYTADSRFPLARSDLEEAKRLAPDDPAVNTALADFSHYLLGRQDQAIAGYKAVLAENGTDAATQTKLGQSYVMAHKFDLARQALDKVLEKDPNNVDALIWRSIALANTQHFDLALADVERVVALDPGNTRVRQWRGEELVYAGEFARAIDDFDKALAERPEKATYRLRGVAEYMTGRYQAAGEDFLRDMDLSPVLAHLAVWQTFAMRRAGAESGVQLDQIVTALNGAWPTPVLNLLLGRASVAEVEAAAAAGPDTPLRRIQQSQAHCIIGEWLLLKNDRAGAAAHFKISEEIGVVIDAVNSQTRPGGLPADSMIEYAIAHARMKELAR
jgi:tetratricopeptide (TPR) repeat protein